SHRSISRPASAPPSAYSPDIPRPATTHHRLRPGRCDRSGQAVARRLEPLVRKSVIVLGLNAYHGDVSAVLVRDGQLVAAVEEERLRRIKHCAGFPHHAARECLRLARIDASAIDLFAISRNPRAHLWRKGLFLLRHRPRGTVGDRARNFSRIGSLPATIGGSL